MRLKEQLLLVSSAFCAADGRSEARISTLIYGAGGRLRSLRAGKDMLSGNVELGLQWFSDRWPEGAEWPDQVTRPAPSSPPAEDDAPPEPGARA